MNEKTGLSAARRPRATSRCTWRGVAVTAALLLASCGGGDESSSADKDRPTTTVAPTTTVPAPAADKARAERIVLTAANVPGFTAVPGKPSSTPTTRPRRHSSSA